MKKTYVIVDDDVAFTALLKKRLSKFPDLECLATFSETIAAATGITKHRPDILFLDMKIDSLDGLEVLDVLDQRPKTIIISSSSEYVKTALSFEVYDYIQKSDLTIDRLKVAIDKVI